MDKNDLASKVLAYKMSLLKQLLSHNQNVDAKCFCSLMSLCCKQIVGNDNIVQNFEIYIFRPNGRAFRTMQEIMNFIGNEENEYIGKRLQVLKKILIILQEAQTAMVAKNNDAIMTDGLKTKQFLEQQLINCLISIEECIQEYHTKKDEFSDLQLSIDDVLKTNVIKLSPTTGILYLNNNPYQFFAEKILFLSQVGEWENIANAKVYGTIVHKIFEKFAIECKNIHKDVLSDVQEMRKIFFDIAERLLLDAKTNDDDFMNNKVKKLFKIAYKLEYIARQRRRFVLTEAEFSTKIQGIMVSAKADRVEIDYQRKEVYIYDFKTGTLPSNSDETNGVKAQLAIIGYLILQDERYKDYKISLMRYVDTSGKGVIYRKSDIDLKEINFVEAKLKKMVDTYFYNCSPMTNNMFYVRECQQNKFDNEHNLAYFAREEFLV